MGSPVVTITPDAVASAPPSGVTITPDQPKEGGIKGFLSNLGSDLWETAKGVGKMAAQPPQDRNEKIASMMGGGALQIFRMGKAYVQAVQRNAELAKQHAEEGDTSGSMINSVAAGLPLVGPLATGVYEQAKEGDTAGAMGTGASRILQAASMAPEGSSIPNPAALAGKAIAAPINAIKERLPDTAADLYRSSLKPSTTLSPARSNEMIQTALKNEIPVSEAGAEKLHSLVEGYNDAIADTIKSNPQATINPNKAAQAADALKSKFANQVNAGEDLSAIENAKQQFLSESGAKPGTPAVAPKPTGLLDANGNPIMDSGTPAKPAQAAPPMSAEEAQAKKVGTYRQMKGRYGQLSPAAIEAQKALARGIKEELQTQFPELQQLNAREGKLLDLQPVLERAIGRTANYEPIPVGAAMGGAGMELLTGSKALGTATAALKYVLRNPEVRTRLAIALNKAGAPGGVSLPIAFSRIASYENALGQHAAAANSAPPAGQSSEQPQQ